MFPCSFIEAAAEHRQGGANPGGAVGGSGGGGGAATWGSGGGGGAGGVTEALYAAPPAGVRQVSTCRGVAKSTPGVLRDGAAGGVITDAGGTVDDLMAAFTGVTIAN